MTSRGAALGRAAPRPRGLSPLACLALALTGGAPACGSRPTSPATRAPIAILGAMPSELEAVLAHVDEERVERVAELDGRAVHVGHIGDVPVIATLTRIGLENATTTTRALLDRFEVAGLLVAGVAGSPFEIGDVTVPATWELAGGGPVLAVDPGWLARADTLRRAGAVALERCTSRPVAAGAPPVCLADVPDVIVGGRGSSSDPFGGRAFPCGGHGDVFGCDVARLASGNEGDASATAAEPIALDMETAAIAAVAAEHGVPFLAFRAVSDGAGDPLGLPGFPFQFFAYVDLAAANAAATVAAFLIGG